MISEKIFTISINCLMLEKWCIERNNLSLLQKISERHKKMNINRKLISYMHFLVFNTTEVSLGFFQLKTTSISAPWKDHICSLSIDYLFLTLLNTVNSCQLFSFEQTSDSVLHKWIFLSFETSVSPSCISFIFPSSSKNTSVLGTLQTQRCISLRAVLAWALMTAPKTQDSCCSWCWDPREHGWCLYSSSWTDLPGSLRCGSCCTMQLLGKGREAGDVLSLFPPGFQIEVIFKSKCNEVDTVFIEVTSFSNYIYWHFLKFLIQIL